ncbi:DUF4249 domain-containing protein [Litoribacter populi]|uniref:DUF4249 domain-containing protein n=1 Tax=Litoribacter populi TaxID=2598460 RepID=UPI001180087C|nr:DUF4249 domain-containing protein [Litoribacter populi]
MMKRLFWGLIPMALSGCLGWINQEVEIDLPEHKSKIVLNALLKDGDTQVKLGIHRSHGMMDEGSIKDGLPDANVQMRVNGELLERFSFFGGEDPYTAPYRIHIGDSIDVEIDAPGYASVSSSTVVPAPTELISARFGSVDRGLGSVPQREVFFRVSPPVEGKSYYVLKFAQQREGQPMRTAIQLTSNLPFITPMYPFNVGFESTPTQGTEAEIVVLVSELFYSGTQEDLESYLILETVSKEYYDYVTTFYYHYNNQSPDIFGGEPTPMPSNIVNGYGIFGAASSHMVRIE